MNNKGGLSGIIFWLVIGMIIGGFLVIKYWCK